jgi:hypothetical protein
MSDPIDLGLGILDHQLIDADERRCGKVDDLELEGVSTGSPRVAALLSGPSAWAGRGLVGRVAAAVARRRSGRIPWDEVVGIDSAVRLRRSAEEYGLGRGDDRARQWIRRLPRAE